MWCVYKKEKGIFDEDELVFDEDFEIADFILKLLPNSLEKRITDEEFQKEYLEKIYNYLKTEKPTIDDTKYFPYVYIPGKLLVYVETKGHEETLYIIINSD